MLCNEERSRLVQAPLDLLRFALGFGGCAFHPAHPYLILPENDWT
jgi:hypothetical protein